MRKMDPAGIRADFALGLADVAVFYETANTAIIGDRNRTLLVESTFLSAAVLWEGYVSDLFLAYINRDSTQFSQHLKNALKAALRDRPMRIFDSYASLNIPRHLTRDAIVRLIDPRESNITFRDYNDLREGAGRYLVTGHRTGINALAPADQRTINAVIAIRNHLAHRSRQSYNLMNDALAETGLYNTGLSRGTNHIRQIGP